MWYVARTPGSPVRPSKIAPAITATAADKTRPVRCQLPGKRFQIARVTVTPPITGHYDFSSAAVTRAKVVGKPAKTRPDGPL